MVVKKYFSYYYYHYETVLGFYFYGRREEMCSGRDTRTIKLPSLSAYNVKQWFSLAEILLTIRPPPEDHFHRYILLLRLTGRGNTSVPASFSFGVSCPDSLVFRNIVITYSADLMANIIRSDVGTQNKKKTRGG